MHKAVNAFQHGAAAVILVNNRAGLGGQERSPDLAFKQAGPAPISNIPFLMMTREQADELLEAAGQPSLEDFERKIDDDLQATISRDPGVDLDREDQYRRARRSRPRT